jgi:pyruvate dehydrogenase E2 component (dihydrolipoamide acetyltransferase)
MSARLVPIHNANVAVIEAGEGAPLLYLHGFADVHACMGELQPFHLALARRRRVVALALPGVNGSDELGDFTAVDDMMFRLLQSLDALRLDTFDLVGHCSGGWFAAEFAVRHPDRVKSLALLGASGLFVKGALIGDVFMHAQPERGVDYTTLRQMLFSSSDHPIAREYYPDIRGDIDVEVRRYQMLRFGSFLGFRPPYFYNRTLIDRLYRAAMPARIVWGGKDAMVPLSHAEAYAKGLPGAGGKPIIVPGAGHAVHLEAPEAAAKAVMELY